MRISTVTSNTMLETNVRSLQKELSRIQQQVSTGKIAEVYSGLGKEDARVSIRLRDTIDSRESYIDSIKLTKTRMAVMDAALLQMQDLTTEIRVKLIEQTQGQFSSDLPIMRAFASSAIDRLASLLNSEIAGRYIFSGPANGTEPVINADTMKTNFQAAVNSTVAGGNSANTILGNANTWFNTNTNWNRLNALPTTNKTTIHSGTGLNTSYGEMAHQEIFADLFEVLNIFAEVDIAAGSEAEYRSLVDTARTTVETTFDSIGQKIAELGGVQQRLNLLEDEHRDTIVLLNEQLADIEDIDPFEAVNNFQILRSQIETTYKVSGVSRGLSLVDFI